MLLGSPTVAPVVAPFDVDALAAKKVSKLVSARVLTVGGGGLGVAAGLCP